MNAPLDPARVIGLFDSSGGPDACHPWTRARSAGYGVISINGHIEKAHRAIYSLLVGPIPDGYEIDHICHEPRSCPGGECEHRACGNVLHLAAVPHATNCSHGRMAMPTRRAETCKYGHPWTAENTRIVPPSGKHRNAHRRCRECLRESARARFVPAPPQTMCRAGLHERTAEELAATTHFGRRCKRCYSDSRKRTRSPEKWARDHPA